jgi:hypothetical protein
MCRDLIGSMAPALWLLGQDGIDERHEGCAGGVGNCAIKAEEERHYGVNGGQTSVREIERAEHWTGPFRLLNRLPIHRSLTAINRPSPATRRSGAQTHLR